MIRIQSESGKTLRLIKAENSKMIYYTQNHGFVSERALKRRKAMRLHEGLRDTNKAPLFLLKTTQKEHQLGIEASGQCELKKLDSIQWSLSSPFGKFLIRWMEDSPDIDGDLRLIQSQNKPSKREGLILTVTFLSLFFLLIGILKFSQREAPLVEDSQKMESLPVVVSPVKPAPVVQPKSVEEPQHQALDKKAVAQKALTQNLGFLKLMGKKDLKKAMGGLPTPVPEASAGVGPGGKEGSGGQLLVGMGQGLRKTTVGNSGMAGLGGIGTKGAGGGLGGYGETDYGSGAGRSVSAMPLSQDAVMEGGLDRSAIEATIRRYLSQVRACYEEGLKRKADMIGQVTMNFEISGAGNVNYSHVQRSSLGDREVENCISSRMLTWKFPVPRGNVNVKVSYPFMLRPVKS